MSGSEFWRKWSEECLAAAECIVEADARYGAVDGPESVPEEVWKKRVSLLTDMTITGKKPCPRVRRFAGHVLGVEVPSEEWPLVELHPVEPPAEVGPYRALRIAGEDPKTPPVMLYDGKIRFGFEPCRVLVPERRVLAKQLGWEYVIAQDESYFRADCPEGVHPLQAQQNFEYLYWRRKQRWDQPVNPGAEEVP